MENRGIKILSIDDNQDNLVSLNALIKEAFPGALTFSAFDGARGLELAAAEDPDVILLDVVMPGMDGFEVCKKLKTNIKLSDIPVVFITALKGDKENRIRALEAGAEAFLAKPIDINELTAQIRAMVKIKVANIEKKSEKERLSEVVEMQTSELKKTYTATLNLLEDLNSENESRKKNENALRKSEENLADIFQTVTEGIGYATLTGEIISINPSLERIVNIPKEKIIGKNMLILVKDFLSFENSKRIFTTLTKLIQGKSIENFSFEYKNKILEINATVNLKSRRIIGVIRDITERKKSEEALLLSETRFRHISSSISDISYSCRSDSSGNYSIDWMVGAAERITGYSVEEIIAKKCWGRLVVKEDFPIFKKHILDLKPGYSDSCQLRILIKNGHIAWLQSSAECVLINKKSGLKHLYGGLRDITERKKIEAKMIQSERLSALGEMSAGMAHEINQPLNTLSISFDNILFEAKKDHVVKEDYLILKSDKIFNSILRIKNLIDHVRDFSRKQEGYILTSFNINASILNALSMVSEQFKIAGINLITALDENLPLIKGNTYKFEQVILNLIINSKDALLEKKNRLKEDYPMSVKISTQFDRQRILVEVEDNGIGIKAEHIDKILQPFYTTKDTGKGTGLGLSISYGLVQEMNGKIGVRSEVLKGTTISITLPLTPEMNR